MRCTHHLKQVIQCQFHDNLVVIHTFCQPESGDYRRENGALGLSLFLKGFHTMVYLEEFFLVQHVFVVTILHLTEVDDIVCTVDDDVYLCAVFQRFASP